MDLTNVALENTKGSEVTAGFGVVFIVTFRWSSSGSSENGAEKAANEHHPPL